MMKTTLLITALVGLSQLSGVAHADVLQTGQLIRLVNLSPTSGARFLRGQTEKEQASLVHSESTPGTVWKVVSFGHDVVSLQCQSGEAGPRWLAGITTTGQVKLSGRPNEDLGTKWRVFEENKAIVLRCIGQADGVHFLNGVSASEKVELVYGLDGVTSARWRVERAK